MLYFLAFDAWQLAAVRAYHGLATAIFTPVSMALIADLYREERGKAMGLFSSSTLAGRLLAPSTAGTLIFLAGFHSVFTICAISGLTALIVVTFAPGRVEAVEQREESFLIGLKEALSTPGILAVGLVNAATYFAMQSLETFLPLRLSEAGTATWLIGLLFTAELATLAILKPLAGAASDRMGRLPVILVGAMLASIGVLTVSAATTALLTALGLVTFASGVAMITASATPLASELAPRGKYGAAIGSLETIQGHRAGPRPNTLGRYRILCRVHGSFFIPSDSPIAISSHINHCVKTRQTRLANMFAMTSEC